MKVIKYITILLSCQLASADQYDEALDKATEAAYIQTGIKDKVDKAQKLAEKEAMLVFQDIGIEKEVGACIYLFKVYRDKSISFPIDKNKRIKLEMYKAAIEYRF